MNSQGPKPEESQKNQDLMQSSRTHDLEKIQSLLNQGANVNYIQFTDSCSWYEGNTHTPLSVALENKPKCD